MAEPHICRFNWLTSNPDEEFVIVANGGLFRVQLRGLMLTDSTATQQNVHNYDFPDYDDGTPICLERFESVVVSTGTGRARWETCDSGKRWLLLFMQRNAPIWNGGDVAYSREANGEIVDWVRVGNPARHPGGH